MIGLLGFLGMIAAVTPVGVVYETAAVVVGSPAKKTLGRCVAVPSNKADDVSKTGFWPESDAAEYMYKFRKILYEVPGTQSKEFVEKPRNGNIIFDKRDIGVTYIPREGFVGTDVFAFDVQIAGEVVRVRYFVRVMNVIATDNIPQSEYCGKHGDYWKVL